MTPEEVGQLRDMWGRHIDEIIDAGDTPLAEDYIAGRLFQHIRAQECRLETLHQMIEGRDAEIAALRRGQGTAPAPATPGTVAFHVTHPIPDSTGGPR